MQVSFNPQFYNTSKRVFAKPRSNSYYKAQAETISFSALKASNNIAFKVLATKDYNEILKALMKLNNPKGPLVENMFKYFLNKNPKIKKDFLKKAIAKIYVEQAKAIANIACNNKLTIIATAVDKAKNDIVGIAVLLPVGQANGNKVNIFEFCNFGVEQKHQKQRIGLQLFKKILTLAQSGKNIVFVESINPTVRKFLLAEGFQKPNTANNLFILESMGIKYSSDWFFFKEFNFTKGKTLDDLTIATPILDAWNKGWPDWSKYD